jgi:hypothetical protein
MSFTIWNVLPKECPPREECSLLDSDISPGDVASRGDISTGMTWLQGVVVSLEIDFLSEDTKTSSSR